MPVRMDNNTSMDGLNYVPRLSQSYLNRPGSRLRFNTPAKRSGMLLQKSAVVCYNGNYEGDATMFSHTAKQQNRLELIETDSDTEYLKELYVYKAPSATSLRGADDIHKWRMWSSYMDSIMTPERLEKIAIFSEELHRNYCYRKLWEFSRIFYMLLAWLLHYVLAGMMRFSDWSYGFCKSRSGLRNTARRLLWWMTLAKCGDVTFFVMILVATPFLFAVATVGCAFAVYCAIKEWLSHSSCVLRSRVF